MVINSAFPSFYTTGSGSPDPNECGSDRIWIQIRIHITGCRSVLCRQTDRRALSITLLNKQFIVFQVCFLSNKSIWKCIQGCIYYTGLRN